MKSTRALIAALALGTATCVAGLGVYEWASGDRGVSKGSRKLMLRDAPSWKLPDDRGHWRSLEDFRGQVVILHFWATWCAPCVDEIPKWVELSRQYEGKRVAWVAISLDHSWDEAHRFLKPERLPRGLISLLDHKNETPGLYGSYQFPETYLIGPDLKILSKWVGPQAWDSEQMSQTIHKVLEITGP